MTPTKPYDISMRMVLEAYRHVKANRGAAGIDDESIEMFEANLSRNLYKLWNRLASGRQASRDTEETRRSENLRGAHGC